MRRLLVLLFVLANIVVAGLLGGVRLAGALGLAWLGILLFATILLPRAAHRAFNQRRFVAAARRYRLLGRLSISPERRLGAQLSVAACALGGGELTRALRLLDAIDPETLVPAHRAAWLNNRAYALVRGDGGSAERALALAEEAFALRPDVPSIAHTLGITLLAAGRTDEAIAALEAVWAGGALSPALDGERCADLAEAWTRRGQLEYAAEYRARAASLLGRGTAGAAAVSAPAFAELGGEHVGTE